MWKPTKKHNSVNYGPLAPISVSTIQPPLVPVYTKFQLSGFQSSREKFYEKFSLMTNT